MRLIAAALLIAAASPALAQPADPIGALLQQQQTQPARSAADLEEPDTAAEPAAAPEPEIAIPAAPVPYAPPAPRLTEPVFVDQTGKNPDAPPSVRDLAYESRLRASFASAQSFQGPLDGAWTLTAADGAGLYAFKLVDRSGGTLEGAWRDLRRPGALGASGFVDEIRRDGGRLTLRFGEASANFSGGYGDRWSGELVEGGQRRTVTLVKAPPQP
ncbi:hypothetical protein [Phenylobacterium sp.]|uniref:hypothetical protein n=1 Tax=Phenylobacterium sp. TaxID=1871053 RepID=UPI0035AFA36D